MSGTPLAQRLRTLSEARRDRSIDEAILTAKDVFGALNGAVERDIITPWQCTSAFSTLALQWKEDDVDDLDQALFWHPQERGQPVPFLSNQVRAMAVWQGALRACQFTDIDERPIKKQEPGTTTLSPLDRVINAVNRDVELPLGLTHIWSNNLLGDALHGIFVLQLEDEHLGIFIGRSMGGVDRVAILGLQPFAANWRREEGEDYPPAEIGQHTGLPIEEDGVWVTSRPDRADVEWWAFLASYQRTLLTGTLLQFSAGHVPDILTPNAPPSLEGISLLPRTTAHK